ncbi:hypothetical protein P280DRAFT_482161 [Massarina eburnea CBS 473.64]|uniref:Uncharacterized protein n=1 Tax=Massarina eburnea CBS 473.64 TaxID=1395130 RepID=A0A6A6RU77_9PLEO|nr:hypothetical protein P280DRAFT_482161 [Massarina eburnea CBS 473.64]
MSVIKDFLYSHLLGRNEDEGRPPLRSAVPTKRPRPRSSSHDPIDSYGRTRKYRRADFFEGATTIPSGSSTRHPTTRPKEDLSRSSSHAFVELPVYEEELGKVIGPHQDLLQDIADTQVHLDDVDVEVGDLLDKAKRLEDTNLVPEVTHLGSASDYLIEAKKELDLAQEVGDYAIDTESLHILNDGPLEGDSELEDLHYTENGKKTKAQPAQALAKGKGKSTTPKPRADSARPTPPSSKPRTQKRAGIFEPHGQPASVDIDTTAGPAYSSKAQAKKDPLVPSRLSKDTKLNWTKTPLELGHAALRQATGNRAAAARTIRQDLDEPLYSLFDAEIRDSVWQVRNKIERFASKHFDFGPLHRDHKTEKALLGVFGQMTPETVKIIGCVASGGPKGENGWKELFLEKTSRRALVCAVIGNVIVEQVFMHPCFGGDANVLAELADAQEKFKDEDGFIRQKEYASIVDAYLNPDHSVATPKPIPGSMNLPHNFSTHVRAITAAITVHIKPFIALREALDTHDATQSKTSNGRLMTEFLNDISVIVVQAGILSLQMRMDPHTVYYLVPQFKEDDYTHEDMEAFNQGDMVKNHPRGPNKEWDNKITDAEKSLRLQDEALTQITIMNGITAYRKGGWETWDSEVWAPKYAPVAQRKAGGGPLGRKGGEERNPEAIGIRSRLLCHGWVYCRWGKARKFKDGKPADDKRVHGTQWQEPGFVEFTAVAGVPKPKPNL